MAMDDDQQQRTPVGRRVSDTQLFRMMGIDPERAKA